MNPTDSSTNPSQFTDGFEMARWVDTLNQLPVAGCLLSDNAERCVLSANKCFYTLTGWPRDEFQYRFGGRLSAITLGEWPVFNVKSDGETLESEHLLRTEENTERWIRITERYLHLKEGNVIFCVVSDITAEKNTLSAFSNYQNIFERANLIADSETFEYDIVTQQAAIYHGGVVLNQVSPEVQKNAGSFQQVFFDKGLIEKDDAPAFQKAFTSICRGETAICEARIHTDFPKERWMRLTMVPEEHGSDSCRKAVGILQNITELKAANLRCLSEAQFLQALLVEKDTYVQVDVTNDKMLRVGGRWFLYSGLIHSTGYSRLLADYMIPSIYPEDRDYYMEFMRLDNMTQALDNGIDRLSCRVRRMFEQNEISWIEVDICLFRSPFTQNIEALISSERLEKSASWTSIPEKAAAAHSQELSAPQSLENFCPEFEHFLSEQADIAYLVDMDTFELITANEAFYRRIGFNKEECAGKTCYWLMHHRSSPCPFCGRANWSKEKFYVWKNWNAVLQQDFLIKNKIVKWQGKDALFALAVDVSSDKSLFDTLEDGGGESHSVLVGIQKMSEAKDLDSAISSSLETIGSFYNADAVQYWAYHQNDEHFSLRGEWKQEPTFLNISSAQHISQVVNQWMHKRRWTYPVVIENQEAMLCHSFEMYELLKEAGIWNQRWIPLREGDALWGIFIVMNISSHFQNTSFMDTFSVFLLEEWRNKTLVDEMAFAVTHDDMTGFYNKRMFEQFIQEFSPDEVTSLGVVSIVINELEEINEQQGISIGDDCVRHFASKFRSAFHDGMLYRVNGREFTAILTDYDLEKLIARLEELEDGVVSCRRYSISVGYCWDNIEKELALQIQQASQSMKYHKQQQFDSVSKSSDMERQVMIQNLLNTLEKKEFEVFMQPKVNLFTGKLMGAEALVRYRDQVNGIIPPSHFIDILEKNNLIRFIDFFVFEECCRILQKWKQAGLQLPVVSFNFSRLTLLERDIVSSVEFIFSKYQIPKDRVEIEITESVADLGKGVLYQTIHELYQAGFSISLDDFGTKYTNLDILSESNFDMLKVDKSLVSLLTKRRSNQIILQNIITMCKHLNIGVIAEGVENKAQEAVLRVLGCKYGQGYLYGRPMPIADFEERFM